MAAKNVSPGPAAVKATRPSRAELLRQRAELLEHQARIDRELADLEAMSAPADMFSSIDLPPGVTRRAFREAVARIVGAHRIGHTWFVPRAAWFARAKPGRAPLEVVTRATVVGDVDAIIANAGLRATRRAS